MLKLLSLGLRSTDFVSTDEMLQTNKQTDTKITLSVLIVKCREKYQLKTFLYKDI